MGTWEPIFWIIGASLAFFGFLMLLELLKKNKKKQ
jgi:hypothetical protein